jgi:hypothetical protein
LPSLGIPAAVPDGKDEDVVLEKLVVDDIGKAAKLRTARLAVYSQPDLRVSFDLRDAGLEALHERGSEA